MSTPTFLTTSEFAMPEEAEAYDHWFRAKVQKSLDDKRPAATHDQVMAAMQKIIQAKLDSNVSDPLED